MIKLIPFLLYYIINSLFILKYGARINITLAVALAVVYGIIFFSLQYCMKTRRIPLIRTSYLLLFSILSTIALIIVQYAINPYHLQVDRWSAIHNNLTYLLQGRYPYVARTHLGGYGSPFPVWQIFHLPFYALKNVGLSLFFAVWLFFFAMRHRFGIRQASLLLILLFASPAFLYETLVRSDLMTNFLICLSIILFTWNEGRELEKHILCFSVLCGLLLSTRFSVGIPLLIFLLPSYLKMPIGKQLLFPVLVLIVFGLTFLPLLLWDDHMLLFFQYNPFVLQTRQGSLPVLIVCGLLCVLLALSWRDNVYYYLINSGLALFALVLITFAYNMISSGNYDLFSSTYDITYFDMSLPFICSCIASNSFISR